MVKQPHALFHRAHYNILAAQIRRQLEPLLKAQAAIVRSRDRDALDRVILKSNTLTSFAVALTRRLQEDNPSFDPIKFLDACSPDSEQYPLSELWDD